MLRRLRAYVRKIFQLDRLAETELHDIRQEPRLALASVWLTALLMYLAGHRSLRAMDQTLRRKHGTGRGGRPAGAPSERTIRRVLGWLDLGGLRAILKAMVQTLRRNKVALAVVRAQGLVAAALDAKEMFVSSVRGCADCQERLIHVKDRQTGQMRTQKQYYHQVVVCFVVDALIPILLDVELVRPGEGELSAAQRLLRRVLKEHARLLDVVTCDALYADKTFLQTLRRAAKHFVVVLKDPRRELYDEADRLRRQMEPIRWSENGRQCTVWDIGHLPSWWGGRKIPLRVIWSQEKSRQPKPGRQRGQTQWITSTWVWLTDLSADVCDARTVWHFGHRRWHVENRCFHEGVVQWGFDHCFHHSPNAICAFLLTMSIAIILVHTFLKRNLKEAVRKLYTVLALRLQFLGDLGRDLSWSGWVRGYGLDTT